MRIPLISASLAGTLFFAGCSGGSSMPPSGTGLVHSAATQATALVPEPVARVVESTGCTAVPLHDGIDYAVTFTPYSCTSSPWNVRVSASPTYAANSAAVIASEFASGNTQPVRSEEAGPYDYGHPIYYTSTADPVVNVHCTSYCNHVDNGGIPATVRIPALARPAGGSDAHLAVVQPDGTEIDLWATTQPSGNWTNGSTVTAASVANCGSFTGSSGFLPTGPAATAGGACLGAGLLRGSELAAGAINHALFLVAQCAVGSQYPAYPGASTSRCSSGVGPALGGRLWYDVPDATTSANGKLNGWEKAILNALHDYGGYVEDFSGGGSSVSGIAFLAESDEPAYAFGEPSSFAPLVAEGWSTIKVGGAYSLRYMGANPWTPSGVNFAAHMHWLSPCSAQQTC